MAVTRTARQRGDVAGRTRRVHDSALRPAASATMATRASTAARRWNGEGRDPTRSRARVSTNADQGPDEGEAERDRSRPERYPRAPRRAGRRRRLPPSTRRGRTWSSPEGPEGRGRRTVGATTAGSPTSTSTSPCTVTGPTLRTGRPLGLRRPRSTAILPSRIRTIRPAAEATLGVVGHQHDRLPACVQAAEELDDLLPALRVQCAGRLVSQEQRGLVGQGPCDGQPLPLSAREHPGHGRALSPMPRRSRRSRARDSAALRLRPAMTAGRATFSRTVIPSSRLKNWKTMPMWRRRSCDKFVLGTAGDQLAGHRDRALVGNVEPGDQVERVDLPHPDGPIRATKSPDGTTRLAPRSARTGAFSASNVLRTFSTTKASMSAFPLSAARPSDRQASSTSLYAMTGVSRPLTNWGGRATVSGVSARRRPCACGHHGLTRIGQLLEPLGHVDRVPDQRVLQALLRAEQGGGGLPGGEAEAEAEGGKALLLPAVVDLTAASRAWRGPRPRPGRHGPPVRTAHRTPP